MASISSMSFAVVTWLREYSMAASLRWTKSASVPLTVLRMSRYAASMSFAAFTMYMPVIMMAGVMVEYRP